MPGKVNPVIPEAVAMVAAQVIGNDATITIAGQSGNFQLNVMLPVIALNLLQSIELLANAARALADTRDRGLQGQPGAARGRARAQPDPRDGAESRHRLRERRGDREAGLRRRAADPRGRRAEDRARASELRSLLDPPELTRAASKAAARRGGAHRARSMHASAPSRR